jgi:hypothetical protein
MTTLVRGHGKVAGMKAAAIVGIILIVLGAVGLIHGGITYTSQQTTVQVGPIAVTTQQKKTIPISSVAGAVLVAGGILLLAWGGGGRR